MQQLLAQSFLGPWGRVPWVLRDLLDYYRRSEWVLKRKQEDVPHICVAEGLYGAPGALAHLLDEGNEAIRSLSFGIVSLDPSMEVTHPLLDLDVLSKEGARPAYFKHEPRPVLITATRALAEHITQPVQVEDAIELLASDLGFFQIPHALFHRALSAEESESAADQTAEDP